MKTTIEIPESLFRQAKARAALEGISLREFLLRGLQLAVQSAPVAPERSRVRFPLIRAAAGQGQLTDEAVYAALDSDEDLR